jgi:hypothetical protein
MRLLNGIKFGRKDNIFFRAYEYEVVQFVEREGIGVRKVIVGFFYALA